MKLWRHALGVLATISAAAAVLSCGANADGGGGGGGGSCDPSGGGGTAGSYDIVLRYLTPLTDAQKAAFEAAAARIEAMVTSHPSSVQVTWDSAKRSVCRLATGDVPDSEVIDGLVIFASVESLGSGTLAESGPCLIRSGSQLPLAGVMIFNSSYIDALPDAEIRKTVLHEMLHTLGFGTLWENAGRDLISGGGAPGASFTGKQALCGAKALNSAPAAWTKVPIEDCVPPHPPTSCGDGTRDSHWRWAVFQDELMTGWISAGVDQPLSATTIGSLRDIGYTVDPSKADDFAIPSEAMARSRAAVEAAPSGIWLGDDVRRVPPLEVPEP